ncbi:MAG: dephospho-CoA kinase [Deltaproteobacteria bacterium]|nr:dephospho-CoA kinase [Deltaproteobacteria bacterium]
MRIIGLTGGIASGKTTVRGMFCALGASVLDADVIYHDLIAPVNGKVSPLAYEIEQRFCGVLTDVGEIDRCKLGARVFANAEERAALEAITHPAVHLAVEKQISELSKKGIQLVIYDIPLLFENNLENKLNGVIVVWVQFALQLQRLMVRDHLTKVEAELRINSQMPLDQKRQRATWVIDASGTLASTQMQVEKIWLALN